MRPGTEAGQKAWAACNHTVPETLSDWVKSMPPGYRKEVWGWEFADAHVLDVPQDIGSVTGVTFANWD